MHRILIQGNYRSLNCMRALCKAFNNNCQSHYRYHNHHYQSLIHLSHLLDQVCQKSQNCFSIHFYLRTDFQPPHTIKNSLSTIKHFPSNSLIPSLYRLPSPHLFVLVGLFFIFHMIHIACLLVDKVKATIMVCMH